MDGTSLRQLTAEQRFELFLESATDYAIFFTDQAGTIIEWNSGAQKIIGYSEKEALGRNGRMIFMPEDQAAGIAEKEMEKAARDGQANDERWHVRKDRSRFFAVGRLIALKSDDGHVFGFAKVLRDATPYKSLEEALRLSDQQFRATFAQAPLGMVLTDLEGRVLQSNAAFGQLTGFTPEELRGSEALMLTATPDRDKVTDGIERLFHGESASFTIEKRLKRADGSQVWVQNSGAVLRDVEGRPISVIDLCQDITPLKLSRDELEALVEKRTSALREKTKQMESFCYTVAHDLRAPLRTIAGYAEFLRLDYAPSLDSNALQYLRKIEESAARLDRLIHDLLGYTRVQQIPLIREQVDLTSVVDRIVDQMQREIGLAGARIEISRPLATVRADAATLEHVFLNLISNALKFRREDVAPVVNIHAEDRGERVRVWVDDNGIGIDPKFADRVFRMFERVHDSQKYPGTGVGLAIVATAMERLGGECGVEPNPSGGSRFWLDFIK